MAEQRRRYIVQVDCENRLSTLHLVEQKSCSCKVLSPGSLEIEPVSQKPVQMRSDALDRIFRASF